jgi:hypothetical protein
MKAKRYYRVLAAMLVLAMLASAAFAIPERPPKTNFGSRKKKITVARLKEAYGKPYFHLTYDEPMAETVATESREKLAKIHYDEEIASPLLRRL